MERAQILTPWTITDGENTPLLPTIHTVASWVDATGQPAEFLPPTPSLYAIEVTATTAVLDTIAASSNYYILWRQEIP
jgi:hypothetical protein